MPAIPRNGIVSMFNNPAYSLIQNDDLPTLAESVGLPRAISAGYRNGFAYIDNGEIIALWGYTGLIPYNSKLVTRLYYAPIDTEIVHMFWAIGEIHKTKRYPKTLETFWARARRWIDNNKPDLKIADVSKFTAIAAYNARYIGRSALELYGVDSDSLYLER